MPILLTGEMAKNNTGLSKSNLLLFNGIEIELSEAVFRTISYKYTALGPKKNNRLF